MTTKESGGINRKQNIMSKLTFIIAILIVGLFSIVQNVYANALPEPEANPEPVSASFISNVATLFTNLGHYLGFVF